MKYKWHWILGTGLALGSLCSASVYATESKTQIKNGGLRIQYGQSSFRVGGRAQFDALYADEDITPIPNGTDVRRARLFVAGKINPEWKYKLQYDFSEHAMKDLYITYKGCSVCAITIGQFAPAMFLESYTSSKWTTLIERAGVDNFALARELGIQYAQAGDNYSARVSITGDNMEYDENGDDGYSLVGRFTFAPRHGTGDVLHFGLTGALMETTDNSVSYGARPNSKVDGGAKLIKASMDNADQIQLFGLESAGVWGSFSAQAEYVAVTAVANDGSEDETYSAFYVSGSYFVTGESRSYYVESGAFDSPTNMDGALELAIRADHIDLDDDSNGISDNQGKMDMLTLGINYYPNSSLRFSANYVNAEVKRNPDSAAEDEKVNLVQFRTQLVF